MATEEERGATAASSYGGGGGGAGGKFRRKPFRGPTTPYDRPSIALRGNGDSSTWLTKLVVEPASKLISYGAHRLLSSFFRQRPPLMPPPHTSELDHRSSDESPEIVLNNQYDAQGPTGGECRKPVNCSSSNAISELEQLLKKGIFARSEIDHLTELLQSKAGKVTIRDDTKRNEERTSDFGKHQQFASSSFEGNGNERGRSSFISTPISTSNVLEDDIASPAGLAKAYMGSRPSKVSPLKLGLRGQVSRGDTGLLSNMRVSSKSTTMALTTKTPVGLGASENGFIAPRSQGRSAIYQMSRSRSLPTSTLKFQRSAVNNNGSGGLTIPSASLSLVEHDFRLESKSMTLKRRSSVLYDDVGSVGPIRRIRQKSNLIAPRVPRAADRVRIDSDVSLKQKLPLIGESKQFPKDFGENTAARIFQHLENLTPKKKSAESKLVADRGKSPLFGLPPSMLHGQALGSMEYLGSSKLLLDIQDDYKLHNRSNVTLSNACDSTTQEQGHIEENGPKESVAPSDKRIFVVDNDSAVPLKASWLSTGTSNSVVKSIVSEPTQNNGAFGVSTPEDDDMHNDRLISRPFFERRGPMEAHLSDSRILPAQEPKLLQSTIQLEDNSPMDLRSGKTAVLNNPDATTSGEGNGGTAFPALDEAATAAAESVLPPSAPASDKPKEASNHPPLFSFNSKVADEFPCLHSESSDKVPETKPDSSNRLANIAPPTGFLAKISESKKDSHLNPSSVGDTVPSAASNDLLVSSPPTWSFTTASNKDASQIYTGGSLPLTSSTRIESFAPTVTGTSTFATPSGSNFGSDVPPSVSGEPVPKFGASIELSTAVPAGASMINPLGGDLKSKVETVPSSGSASDSLFNGVVSGATYTGSRTFGLSFSTGNNLQDSLFTSASKYSVSTAGTVSQGPSVQSVSSAPSLSFNTNVTNSFVSSSSSSQVVNPTTTFGSSSSVPTSDNTGAATPSSAPLSSVLIFHASSTATSDSNPVSPTSLCSFALGSSSTSTNSVVPTGGLISKTTSSFRSGIFDISAGSSCSATNIVSSNTSCNVFSCSTFGSMPSSALPSTSFSSGASAPTPIVCNSTMALAPSPIFSFTTPSVSSQPVLGNPDYGFAASPGTNNQMSADYTMAEDPVQSTAPFVPAFSSPANPFQFGGQENQAVPSSSPFQASSSLQFNAGSDFSVGSGGGRRFVKINRNKNRRR